MRMQMMKGAGAGFARLALPLVLAALGACQDDGGEARPAPEDPTGLEVAISEGKLQGKLEGTTRLFLGIPYAAPPLGARRFAPPEPVAPWEGVKQAVAHGPSCVQNTGGLAAPGPQSEDCLSLNVYAPSGAEKLPVMVWIHGGAFVSGGSVQYDGTRLASEGTVVVVTLNYRLGAFGFLAHAGLDQTRGPVPSGNDAIRDQQLALRWVQRNIAAFGGDPGNVTLVGESAGASSVCTHMVSPESRGLAVRFVLQSGVCTGGLPISAKAAADAVGADLASALCPGAADALACLRETPTAEFLAWDRRRGLIGAGWNPVFNAADPVLPEHPLALIRAGKQSPGELLLGTNKNEWFLFVALTPDAPVNTRAVVEERLRAQFGLAAELILAQYAPTDATASATFVRLMTDAAFRCPTRLLARTVSAQGTKVYLYSFEEGVAMHGNEVPYVFGNPSPLLGPTLIEPLRERIQSYWRSFAQDGDPNVEGALPWPAYEPASDRHLVLKATSEVSSGLASADCDFWDQLSAAGPLPSPQF